MAFPDGTADFRSDTVTRPTPEMRRAMAEAEVGDDAYGDDPTVNTLEREAAELVGKRAAVFVPTGTMGNQLAINCQTSPGEAVVCVPGAHLRLIERGAAAALSGVQFSTTAASDGAISVEDVRQAVAEARYQGSRLTLLSWENSHNVSGGRVVALSVMEETSAAAREEGLAIHLDGARIFNAVVASGLPAGAYAATADTVMFCFSKGLGAPIGSILCGSEELVAEARYRRKRFGGGMRQAGVVAAAARIALRDRERLHEDHHLARRLADGLADRFPKALDAEAVETNMVLVDEAGLPVTAEELRAALAARGILVNLSRPGLLRFVTHRDVDVPDVDRVLAVADQLGGDLRF
ncbi:MAG: aminotransferase class I/II-fold pyridoxal phosphate-dependent enzyme [Actinomycetota bacterium]|nr:aminotransferase class I/II-fold pyridoxal phosphate-dependent enzyme [Actinomycetota bacterium]